MTLRPLSPIALIFLALLSSSFLGRCGDVELKATPLVFNVNLNDRSDDTFKVSILEPQLGREHSIYQFAATAPGTYQTMDIGRYVRTFQAFDQHQHELRTERIGTNAFKISSPERVKRINYTIAETWDTKVDEHEIYPMAGSSLEEDHALINGQTVFGFFRGLQARPLRIFLKHPRSWVVGTALEKGVEGAWLSDDYDHVVDSPILLGKLTQEVRRVGNCDVRLFAYSKNDLVQAAQVMAQLDDVIEATDAFLVGFPVDRYTFLYHFEDVSVGAWEHSYSSFYVVSEQDLEKNSGNFVTKTAAHEIFHMVTPLNIHSENIRPFDFRYPKPSAHVWFYEGVTEWAAGIMALRAGQKDLTSYLETLTRKLNTADRMDKQFSLEQIGLESYSPKGQWEWANIYARGAVVAALLDILILQRSDGSRGLRELIQDLAKVYGPHKSFPEDAFYGIVTTRTNPDVAHFIERYIRDTQPLPVEAFFAAVGIQYIAQEATGKMVADVGLHFKITSGLQIVLDDVSPALAGMGLSQGDILREFAGIVANSANFEAIKLRLGSLTIGEHYSIKVLHGDEALDFNPYVGQTAELVRHRFEAMPKLSPRQKKLREAWLTNMMNPGTARY